VKCDNIDGKGLHCIFRVGGCPQGTIDCSISKKRIGFDHDCNMLKERKTALLKQYYAQLFGKKEG